ncbi:MAG: ribonuclease HI [Candidatus Obscuribacterales bacterium]|nr:ribonuclease HI [Candidatus Obscuribacterales bacterium]
MEKSKEITIYTDGACIRNPGRGGYGVVLLLNENRRELQGGFRRTTNNRMEIMAAIVGLQAIEGEGSVVRIYSDSRYLVDSMSKRWVQSWQRRGWKKRYGKPCKNVDLWIEMLNLCKRHKVAFEWVRGHSGNIENARCDFLAYDATKQKDLAVDIGFEQAAEILKYS